MVFQHEDVSHTHAFQALANLSSQLDRQPVRDISASSIKKMRCEKEPMPLLEHDNDVDDAHIKSEHDDAICAN